MLYGKMKKRRQNKNGGVMTYQFYKVNYFLR